MPSIYVEPDPILVTLAARPGSRAGDLGPSMLVAARLRWLRVGGYVVAQGPSPARWYPTPIGQERVNRRRLRLLRARGREARKRQLAAFRRAEDLSEFAATLTKPSPPLLEISTQRRRTLTFAELASTLTDSVGCDVLISTDIGNVWPQVSPITAVGTIDSVEDDRSLVLEDWLVILTVGETAFVEFSRRHFRSAEEDARLGEIRVCQGVQTTTVAFEFLES
jgi:hypothetical protein